MRAWVYHIVGVLILLQVVTTAAGQSPSDGDFRFFLIGDVGDPFNGKGAHELTLLRSQVEAAGDRAAVIFLGDNIYPTGLPAEENKNREEAEKRIQAQIDAVKGLPARVFFIPGNHDWKKGGSAGWDRVLEQQAYINAQLPEAWFPENACPGPVEVPISKSVTLILFDTQWMLHPWDKPRKEDGCSIENSLDIFTQLVDILKRNQNKKVVVAGHHPLYTNGIHGGYFPLKSHVFPLTDASENLYIPLPVIGSLYPLARGTFGNIQDTHHPRYKLMIRALTDAFGAHPDLVYVAGHEHNLQYIQKDNAHYVVSGAGCKHTRVRDGRGMVWGQEVTGFAILDFQQSGDARLSFWHQPAEKPATRLFDTLLFHAPFIPRDDRAALNKQFDFRDSTAVTVASDQYGAGKFHQFWFGKNYRDTWETAVKLPVFDIQAERGGLEIIKKGGGMQTRSLRMEAGTGKQYVLRSVEKFAEKAVPVYLQGTVGADIVQDQISASHPYAAITVPPMAQAVGVYHANPEVVLIPDDPRFGLYQDEFANTMALYEERPDGAWPNGPFFGNPEDIDGTPKVLEKIQDDNDHRVDQHQVVRSRMFDLTLADWDRHDDQWRWAERKGEYGKVYQPIPRDRDQVFFVNEGVLPKLASRKWALAKFQGFDPVTKHVPGFMFNARYFDRSFMNELQWEDWERQIEHIQTNLTDEVIDQALARWPTEIQEMDAAKTAAILRSRRDNLKSMGRQYYDFLARDVNVVGSNKKERFTVTRLDDQQTRVVVHKLSKKKERVEQVLYDRTFNTKETREIRLFGLKGDDDFILNGTVSKSPKIRIIGGGGADEVRNDSRVKGPAKMTWVYDKPKGMTISGNGDTKDRTSRDPNVNFYDRKEFKYNFLAPLIDVNFNPDDGVFLGAGIFAQTHRFRKDPFATSHRFTANKSFRNVSFNMKYHGEFTQVIKKLDLNIIADIRSPFVSNFFGLGNDTENFTDNPPTDQEEVDIDFYRYRYQSIILDLLLARRVGQSLRLFLGPVYQNFEVERSEGRFITDPETIESIGGEGVFDRKSYAGMGLGFSLDTRDNPLLPSRGVKWLTSYHLYASLNNKGNDYGRFQSDLAFYFSFRLPTRVVFATRFGGGIASNGAEFFQNPTLNGIRNMRGLRRDRFNGNKNFYNNTELRIKLFSFRSYLFPATLGLLAYTDNGRVWVKGESSDTWHTTWGGGLWISPFKKLLMVATVGATEESVGFLFQFGYLF